MPPSQRAQNTLLAHVEHLEALAEASKAEEDQKKRVEREDGASEEEDKPKKKRKASKKGDKGKAPAGPDLFSSLPLDVLYLIARFLNPEAMLALASTSKAIRASLYDQSSACVWTAARMAVGMPDLEGDDLSEPVYAYLVKGVACGACSTKKKQTSFDHHVRRRCCQACFRINLRIETYIRKRHDDLHERTFDCALETEFSAAGASRVDGASYYYTPDVLTISDHLHALEAASPVQVVFDNEAAEGVGEKVIETVSAVEVFVRQRATLKAGIKVDAERIFEYELKSLDENIDAMDELRRERQQAIYAKLDALGYAKEDYIHLQRDWRFAKHFQAAKPLTDASWTSLKKTLLVASIPAGERKTFPAHYDWIQLPSVRRLWEPDEDRTSPALWTPQLRSEIMREVGETVRRTKVSLFSKLARAMRDDHAPLPPDVRRAVEYEPSPLVGSAQAQAQVLAPLHALLSNPTLDALFARATALFACGFCGLRVGYPDIVAHVAETHSSAPLFSSDCAVPHEAFRGAVRGMLSEKGLDEETTTDAQLRGMRSVFEVGLDEVTGRGVTAMRVFKQKTWDEVNEGRQHRWTGWGSASQQPFPAAFVRSLKIVQPGAAASTSQEQQQQTQQDDGGEALVSV
ncbi:hypothetical protein JCM10207_004411 [Rhodosporidiobolus poonsookiae]